MNEGCIEAYIAQQSEETQPRLRQVYEAIRTAIPEAEERLSWGMPTFWKKHNIIHFARQKKHIGLYPGPEAIEAFAQRLTPYKTSKGAIQLPDSAPLPLELISDLARWSYDAHAK